jgi:fatty-acyl-CoA synthase
MVPRKMAGYKRPRSVAFATDVDTPRTATGRILHRVLRERFGRAAEKEEMK